MVVIFVALSMIYFAVVTYIFPLQSRFYNHIKRTFFNAFFMSIRHLFNTIAIIVIDIALVVVSLQIPQVLMLLMLFGFPLVAFINSYILNPVFARYMPEETRDDGELRPLFADEDTKKQSGDETAGKDSEQ